MLYTVDRNGGIHTFEHCAAAESSPEWLDIESTAYVTIDDRGVLYEHNFEADHGYYDYTLRPTNIRAPAALEILQAGSAVGKLRSKELRELARCLSKYTSELALVNR